MCSLPNSYCIKPNLVDNFNISYNSGCLTMRLCAVL